MSCYPVDSADARDRAERAEHAGEEPTPPRRVPMPPHIAADIRATLADKRARHTDSE